MKKKIYSDTRKQAKNLIALRDKAKRCISIYSFPSSLISDTSARRHRLCRPSFPSSLLSDNATQCYTERN